jgi:ferritin
MKQRILRFGLSRFPDATESSQVLKTLEEINEHYDEPMYSENWYMELADAYIAAVHCYERFGNVFCRFIVDQIEERADFAILIDYIYRKMNINEERVWEGDKHVENVSTTKTVKRINYKTGELTEETVNA